MSIMSRSNLNGPVTRTRYPPIFVCSRWTTLLLFVLALLHCAVLISLHARAGQIGSSYYLNGLSPLRRNQPEQKYHPATASTLIVEQQNSPIGFMDQWNESVTSVILKNSFMKDRYLCGTRIPPNSTIQYYGKPCKEPSHLFPTLPSLRGDTNRPVVVRFGKSENAMTKEKKCDIPCRYKGEPSTIDDVFVDGTDWRFIMSMEGRHYYPQQLTIDPLAYQRDLYFSTTSFRSEIPLPYYSPDEYKIQNPEVPFEKGIKGASFLARNCLSKGYREEVVRRLEGSGLIRIDSLSRCLHNAEVPARVNKFNKTAVLELYLLHLAFENQQEDDYITEKLWGTFEAGTIPVYFGAPNIEEHIPPQSAVVIDATHSIEDVALHLAQIVNDKGLYNSYHAWRHQPLPESFHRRYDMTEVHSICRLCRWAYAKKHGWGWNHANQSVQELTLSRTTCLDNQGLVTTPFREQWTLWKAGAVIGSTDKDYSINFCDMDSAGRSVSIANGRVHRSVWNHDGVTDIFVKQDVKAFRTDEDLRLGLFHPFPSTSSLQFRVVNHNQFWLQDDHSRMTILTGQRCTGVEFHPDRGLVEIPFHEQMTGLRIRIIIEDVDTFHEGARDRANYFGNLVAEDFFQPLEMIV